MQGEGSHDPEADRHHEQEHPQHVDKDNQGPADSQVSTVSTSDLFDGCVIQHCHNLSSWNDIYLSRI